jgi:hypothetical protein
METGDAHEKWVVYTSRYMQAKYGCHVYAYYCIGDAMAPFAVVLLQGLIWVVTMWMHQLNPLQEVKGTA